MEKLNATINSKATNLYGWINGKVVQARGALSPDDDAFGYLDDAANHPDMIDF